MMGEICFDRLTLGLVFLAASAFIVGFLLACFLENFRKRL